MIPGSANSLLLASAAAAGGYQVERSLRFNSADSAYLSRTPASAGNRRTFTLSFWYKRSNIATSVEQAIFTTNTTYDGIRIENNSDKLRFFLNGAASADILTTQVFRDPSAWYHFLIAVDTTQGTASNRIKIYANGTQITTFDTSTYPSQNYDCSFNSTNQHVFGFSPTAGTHYLNGYLADIHFIDGQALTPSSFTEVSATTGQLIPLAYSGTFGTNGFWLKFSDNSNNTAATLGKDYSPNGNNWTPNNLSVTAGAGNDSLVDTPTSIAATDTGVGGEIRGNYATLNPLNNAGAAGTYSNGNLEITTGSSQYGAYVSTIATPTSGKWYAEAYITSGANTRFGFAKASYIPLSTDQLGNVAGTMAYRCDVGDFRVALTTKFTGGATCTSGDTVGLALDNDNGEVKIYKNGTLQGTATGIEAANWCFAGSDDNGAGTASHIWNFGQRAFAYTAPSGFKALCDTNLGAPVVAKPNTVMDVVLYTGTGAALTPTSSLGFNPDWIWIKSRSAATDHAFYDVVRGAQARLESNNSDAEVTSDDGVTAFNSAGFTLGTLAQVNTSSATYAAWCWDAGTSTVSNTAGSITSQVRANVSAGFSVVTYTGSGITSTIGHGLGVAPQLIITKNRSSGSFNWGVYHAAAGNSVYGKLNLTDAFSSLPIWQNTTPSSTVFYVGNYNAANQGADNYVAYCFAPVVGYSSFGSYTGNGSATDNTFVYTGMRPRFVMLKRSDSTGNWVIWDAVRNSYNVANSIILPNSSAAEYSPDAKIDILSNGFKVRDNSSDSGTNGATYIYAAFAESPFAYARAR